MTPSRPQSRSRRERGAATVEVALSMILLIPTVLYAIYAGESYIAAMHAQEAEISASWDITAYQLHDYIHAQDYESGPNGEPSHYRTVTARMAQRVSQHLHGLNSYYYDMGRNGQSLVVSQQSLASLECRPLDARGVFNDSLLTFQATPYGTRQYLHRGGYVVCSAEVNFSPQLMPRRLRDGYTSKVDLLSDALARGFNICGNGRSLWGCDGDVARGIVVLTNDWGLEDPQQSQVGATGAPDDGRDFNRKYFNVGESVFNATYWNDPEDRQGGIGSQQVRETLQFLLDENGTDWGETSKFKFGFYNPMHQEHLYPHNDHGGGHARAHMSPWDDGESPYTSTRHVHQNTRSAHNYLGHESHDFIDTPP